MSFSDIAVAQRSKEAAALKYFLAYSLTGSLALHVGVLASGIGNFLSRVPELEKEPIEVAIVETPQTQVTEAPQAEVKDTPQPEIKPETPKTIEKTTVTPVAPQPKPVKIEEIQAQIKNIPIQKPVPEVQNREPVRQNSPKIAAAATNQVSKPSSTPENAPGSSSKLQEQLRGIRDSLSGGGGGGGGGGSSVLTGSGSGVTSGSGSGTGNGVGSGSGNGVGSGSGNGVGSGSGNGVGSGSGNGAGSGSQVATAPRNPVIEAPPAPVNRNSGNGRAACRECNVKYSDAARRRGVEGRVEVAVDTDADGNVTNVRIARSSGNRELDEDTARQARDWKLKPADGGRQGVSIATEFAIQGSRRHSEVQKRRQQREAEERTQQAAASSASTNEDTPRRRRRLEASSSADNSSESTREPQTRQRRSLTSASETESRLTRRLLRKQAEITSDRRTSGSEENVRESQRQTRREQAASDSSPQPQPTRNRRRKRTEQARPASQTNLIESLRRSRQAAPAAAPEAPATENTEE